MNIKTLPISKLKPAGIDLAFGNWLAGFVDGEGCFGVRVPRLRGSRRSPEVQIYFSICLRDDDAQILHEINSRLGLMAKVKHFGPTTNRHGVTSNPKVLLEVRGWRRCLRLVEIFDTCPLRAKKKVDYERWKRMIIFFRDKQRANRWHPPDYSWVLTQANLLREGRKYKLRSNAPQDTRVEWS